MSPLNPEHDSVNDSSNDLPETREQKITHINELFTSGKRCYNLGELFDATDKLAQAAEIAVEVYGEFGPELFEIHYFYGQALLGIASLESNVVENAVQNLETKEDDANEETIQDETIEGETLSESQIEEIEQKVADALEENAKLLAKEQRLPEIQSINESAVPTNNPEVELPSSLEAEEEDGDVTGEPAEDAEEVEDEEPSSLQLAWEVLEVARTICDKQGESKEWDLNKADVLAALANCSVEEAQYKQAIEDLSQCLAMQAKHLDADDRRLAATYFEIGRVYKLNEQFDLAAEQFILAEKIVKLRVDSLTEQLNHADDESKTKLTEELNELKELLPDLADKINDADESARDAKLKETVNEEMPETKQANFEDIQTQDANPASDITNLIRKSAKRIAEAGDSSEVKKVKFAEDGENRESTTLA